MGASTALLAGDLAVAVRSDASRAALDPRLEADELAAALAAAAGTPSDEQLAAEAAR